MRVAVATVQVPFVRGGAELLAENLRAALQAAGHEAEIVSVPFRWYPAASLPTAMLACRLLDLTESMGTPIDRMIGLKFPAYLIQHPAKVLWLLHQHRGAYDLWANRSGDLYDAPDGAEARATIWSADGTQIPQSRHVYTISRTVSDRLWRYNGIASKPLYHPPPLAGEFRRAPPGDYLLMPSRMNSLKRQDLVVEALGQTRNPVRVVFIGAADEASWADRVMARAALVAPGRADWLGAVSDARKLALYAEALGVLVPPYDEDLGYATLEAMLSARAVITCTDSGGPLEFVTHGETGLVCDPSAAALADAMDRLWENRGRARIMGDEGLAAYHALGLSWDHVVQCLLG